MKKLTALIAIIAISIVFSIPAMAQDNVATSTTSSTSSTSAIIEEGAYQDNRVFEAQQTQETKRFFPNAGEINYPNSPGIFQQDENDAANAYMLMTINDINEYDVDGQTTAAAKNMAKGGSKRVMVRSKNGPVDEELRLDVDVPMAFVYKKEEGMQSLGIIVVVSDSKKSIAADVFAKVQVEAWKLGGTKLHVKAQGWQRLVRNSGGGIGFTWTGTSISGGQTTAATGVLGAGYAWGQAGYYKHPFIIVHVLAPM
jgi:hypothetical protein